MSASKSKDKQPVVETAVATVAPTILAFATDDLAEFAGAGVSDRREDNIVPFISILQKMSPQVEPRDPSHVKGARVGQLYNTATSVLYDAEDEGAGPLVIQAYSETAEIEWYPRGSKEGKGFVAKHPIDTPLLEKITEVPDPTKPDSKRKIRMLPGGTQLVTTAYHYLVMAETLECVVIALSSTGLQAHRKWNTMLRNKKMRHPKTKELVPYPAFATLSRLRTVYQSNDDGNWYTLAVDDLGFVPDHHADAYAVAREFYKVAITDGVKTAAPPGSDEEGTTINVVPEYGAQVDEEIPF